MGEPEELVGELKVLMRGLGMLRSRTSSKKYEHCRNNVLSDFAKVTRKSIQEFLAPNQMDGVHQEVRIFSVSGADLTVFHVLHGKEVFFKISSLSQKKVATIQERGLMLCISVLAH